jgi:hypothetical protein
MGVGAQRGRDGSRLQLLAVEDGRTGCGAEGAVGLVALPHLLL